ncbi:MAG: hypothetical protein KC635_27120, partial [Myxococcales bacterium]|nr:hypothetical protein [Myxococcales bacterium]
MRRLDIGVEDRALVTVLGADPGWNALVAGALGVAGAVVDIAGPERWDDVVAALRRGELGAVVVLAPSLAAQARALARVEPDVARRVVCRDPGLTATAEWPPGALPVESTLDDLVVAALGAERVGPPVSVELELGRDAVRA